jgi:hypothetical protein
VRRSARLARRALSTAPARSAGPLPDRRFTDRSRGLARVGDTSAPARRRPARANPRRQATRSRSSPRKPGSASREHELRSSLPPSAVSRRMSAPRRSREIAGHSLSRSLEQLLLAELLADQRSPGVKAWCEASVPGWRCSACTSMRRRSSS